MGEDGAATLGDLMPDEDLEFASAEARVVLGPAVRALAPRDRRILELRFFEGWTQEQIAQDIGVTQMQVSRLLSRILKDLRAELDLRSGQPDWSSDCGAPAAGRRPTAGRRTAARRPRPRRRRCCSITRSKTSQTIPDVVSASDTSPARAARLALVTSHGRSPCRNRIRWNATGAMISPVATTDPDSTQR